MKSICDVCERTMKIKSKSKHLKSQSHNEFAKSIRIEETTENLDFFDIDELFNDYMSNNKKNSIDILLNAIKLVFDGEFYPHIKSDLRNNQSKLHLKKTILDWVEYFIARG